MIRSGILNAELNHAIAAMGHGDLMIVCDAGFPIPSSAWRIDLAVVPDLPDLETVLLPISQTLIVERVGARRRQNTVRREEISLTSYDFVK